MRPGEAEFTDMYSSNRLPMLAVANRLLHNYHEAQDAVQEAMLLAWHHWPRLDRRQVRAWLMRMVVNRAIDLWRKGRRVWCTSDFAGDDGEERALPPTMLLSFTRSRHAESTEDMALTRIILSEIVCAMRRLEVRHRRVLLLAALEFTGPECAIRLGIGLPSLHVYRTQARKRLKEEMAHAYTA